MPHVRLGLLSFFLFLGLFTSSGKAQGPALEDLSASLRELLLQSIPPTLHEESHNWGRTSQVPHAVHWKGKGLIKRPEVHRTARNDGAWRKIKLTSRDLKRTLVFKLSDQKSAGPNKMTMNAFLSFQAGIEFEQQIWESGIRLYSGSTRARLRVNLPLVMEASVRVEPGKSFLPDTVFRLRIVKADLSYDQLVVEHIAGIGGSAAKLLGDALHHTVKQLRPSLERDLLAKANAAIVKAGDTREIRIGLGSLFGEKKK